MRDSEAIVETATSSEPMTPSEPDLVPDGDGSAGVASGGRTRRSVIRRVAVLVAIVAAAIVVVGGSPGWMILRLALVGLAGWGLLLLDGRRPVVSALAGAVLAAVGAGFLPHLIDDGPRPDGLAAVGLIASGVTLLVLGIVELVGRRRWWWQLLGAVSAVAVLGIATAVVTPAVAATNIARPELGATPADHGLDADTVRFTTGDDVEIAAWYVPSRNGAAVVLRHGAGSTRSDVLDQAAVLARHGYGVLMTDAQGHGESGGRAMDFGWNGDDEVAAAVDYLETDLGIDRIGLVGMSMGGEEVLGAAGSQPQVTAVVAEGATARRAADKTWLSAVYGLRGAFQELLDRARDGVTDLLSDAEPPTVLRDSVRRSNADVLLITAGTVADEAHAARHIASGAPERVEVWTVPGAGHTGGLATDPAGWERRVIEFLDAHL